MSVRCFGGVPWDWPKTTKWGEIDYEREKGMFMVTGQFRGYERGVEFRLGRGIWWKKTILEWLFTFLDTMREMGLKCLEGGSLFPIIPIPHPETRYFGHIPPLPVPKHPKLTISTCHLPKPRHKFSVASSTSPSPHNISQTNNYYILHQYPIHRPST